MGMPVPMSRNCRMPASRGQPARRPVHERTGWPGADLARPGHIFTSCLGRLGVDRVVVLAAEAVVVDAGRMRACWCRSRDSLRLLMGLPRPVPERPDFALRQGLARVYGTAGPRMSGFRPPSRRTRDSFRPDWVPAPAPCPGAYAPGQARGEDRRESEDVHWLSARPPSPAVPTVIPPASARTGPSVEAPGRGTRAPAAGRRSPSAWSAGFMALLDVSIVNVALPSVREGLNTTESELQWVLSGYALSFGLCLVPAGRLGDARGRRRRLHGRSGAVHRGLRGVRSRPEQHVAGDRAARAGSWAAACSPRRSRR